MIAQSGESGRAFSVVADEIKELADRVMASTKEIAGLIQAVQEESAQAQAAGHREMTFPRRCCKNSLQPIC